MITVWKWPLIVGLNTLRMPMGAEILTAQVQQGQLMLWARVEDSAPPTPRDITVCLTGGPANAFGRYVATVQQDWLVAHVFEGA